jgi:hemoglobin
MIMKNIRLSSQTCVLACVLALGLSIGLARADDSLYSSFGGKEGITKIVDDFVGIVAADKRINFQFAKTDIGRLKGHLVEMVCAATGGPCKYTGRDMGSAHAGMDITEAQFNALAEDMRRAWDKNGVPFRRQNKLLAMLAPMERQIVTK